jgi:hypothetical protein
VGDMVTDKRFNGGQSTQKLRCQLEEHFEEFKKWSETTDHVRVALEAAREDLAHHRVDLKETLKEIVSELRLLRESLVGPATSRFNIPLAAALPVMAALGFVIVILGAVLIVGSPNYHSAKITPSGISVERHAPGG